MEDRKAGTVRIAPQVLTTVAGGAALAVPGVLRVSATRPVTMERLLRRVAVEPGVAIAIDADGVVVDLYLVLDRNVNMLETSRSVQAEVARAIHDTVGMTVREVNVHVEDVGDEPAAPQAL
ncbi:MAG: Asp23/Gls24 family envelope stress response protein [Chloroflexi bacterium]|nr:Asp23/Gls24 family envelope stress response protein [Chloroflexota bacterium]